MGKFTRIPQNTFSSLQLDAGVLLYKFDPAAPEFTDADQICATTGGINVSCVPTYSDLGEDVDNCPMNIQYYYRKLKDVLRRCIIGANCLLDVS